MKNITLRNYLLMCISAIALVAYCYALPQPKVYSRHRLSPEMQARLDHAHQLLKQGQQERRSGDLAEAEADLKACLAENVSTNQFARAELAQIYDAEGRTNDAIQVYQTMLHPPANEGSGGTFAQDGLALIHCAMALNKAGRWPEAVQAYEVSLSNRDMPDNQQHLSANEPRLDVHFDPDVPQPKAMEAMLYVVLGRWYGHDYQNAFPQFKEATAIDPSLAIAHFYSGYALQGQGRSAEAQKAFQKAAALDNGDIKAAALKELPGTMQPR